MGPAVNRLAGLATILFLLSSHTLGSDAALDALTRLNARLPKSIAAAEWQNLSTQPDSELARLRDTFNSMRPKPAADKATPVRITLSESQTKLLLAAEFDGKVWIESWARISETGNPHPARLVREVLFSQSRPMLDAIAHPSGKWIILEPRALSTGDRVLPLPATRPLPRDTRGRLELTSDGGVAAGLPGMRCQSDLETVRCAPASAVAQTLVAGRNYFEDRLGRFYSTAQLEGGVSIRTGLDGRLHALSGDNEIASVAGWGELVARIESNCGVMVLATRATGELVAIDWSAGPAPRELTPALAAGAVAAMWTTPDNKQVTVISKRTESGEYEASQVSVACNR